MLLAAHPDLALAALTLGFLLLYLEANRPGTVLPGCIGVFLVLASVHALGQHRLSLAALACIAAGLVLTGLAIWKPGAHLPVFLSIALLTLGLVKLYETSHIHLIPAVLCSAILAESTVWLGRVALQARRNKRTPLHVSVPMNGTG